MKNGNHPLLLALKRKPQREPMQPEAPRILEVRHSEINGLKDAKPGDPYHVELDGHVHSNHEGHAMIAVSKVGNEQSEPSKDDSISVKTQESHG